MQNMLKFVPLHRVISFNKTSFTYQDLALDWQAYQNVMVFLKLVELEQCGISTKKHG